MSIKSIISKQIEKKLGGYKIQLNKIDSSLPEKLSKEKSVGIIGGGLAGVSTAIFLAERGFKVKIFEKEKYLGGKVGSWPVKFDDGFSTQVEHGFHAFFRQYYNVRKSGFSPMCGMEFEWFNSAETPQSWAQKQGVAPEPITPGMFGYSLLRANASQPFFAALFNEMGPAIIVLAKDATPNAGGFGFTGGRRNSRIDGFTLTGADHAGGLMVNGYARFLEIANNRVIGNHGVYGGGIRVGHPTLTTLAQTAYENASNSDLSIHNNHITQNGSTNGGGGGLSLPPEAAAHGNRPRPDPVDGNP